MTSADLKIKVDKAVEKVEKIMGTIERHEKQAEKKLAIIKENNWNENDRYEKQGTDEFEKAYWLICEYSDKLEDIKSSLKKLADAEKVLGNWKEKYYQAIDSDKAIEIEFPQILKDMMIDLSDIWTNQNIEDREYMFTKKSELSYTEFRKIYSYNKESELNRTTAQFKKLNNEIAKDLVIDLYFRIKDITGNVTEWSGVHFSGNALNGIVKGDKGTAKVSTIMAGGFNIQKLHYRVLVNQIGV